MTAVNSTPGPGQDLDREPGMGGLAGLPGLEAVGEQLAGLIAVLRAEQARRQAGMAVTRAAWKNLVFTGGPGCGKTRAARAVARLYTGLGLLAFGHLREIAAADLAGTTLQETGTLVADAARRAGGDLLMINDAHAWYGLPDRGRHVLGCLYQELTFSRDHAAGQLAVILAGRAARSATCCAPAPLWPPGSRWSSTSPAAPPGSSPRSSPPWPARPGSP